VVRKKGSRKSGKKVIKLVWAFKANRKGLLATKNIQFDPSGRSGGKDDKGNSGKTEFYN
jgi:hypothetical protein